MKNPTREQLLALRARAERISAALPPLRRGADGRLDAASRAHIAASASSASATAARLSRCVFAVLIRNLLLFNQHEKGERLLLPFALCVPGYAFLSNFVPQLLQVMVTLPTPRGTRRRARHLGQVK